MPTAVISRRIVALLLLVFLAGCSTLKYEMRYGTEEFTAEQQRYWPSPPDIPRFAYTGMLLGDDNFFLTEESRPTNAFVKFLYALVGYGEKGEPRTLERPQSGVVGEDGRIYVTDVGQGAIFVFDETGGQLDIWKSAGPGKNFINPIGIAIGANNSIWVADAQLGQVFRLSSDGEVLETIGDDLLIRPTGLARNPENGLIYVSDTHAHLIYIFDDYGNLIDSIGTRGTEEGTFNFPTHLAYANGVLYVTDTMNARVQLFNALGDVVDSFGNRGQFVGEFVRPKGVAVDDEGHIYVIESYNDHLLIYNPDGRFLLPIGGTGIDIGQFYLPGGVWVDRKNRIFVADTFNKRVMVFQYLGGG